MKMYMLCLRKLGIIKNADDKKEIKIIRGFGRIN